MVLVWWKKEKHARRERRRRRRGRIAARVGIFGLKNLLLDFVCILMLQQDELIAEEEQIMIEMAPGYDPQAEEMIAADNAANAELIAAAEAAEAADAAEAAEAEAERMRAEQVAAAARRRAEFVRSVPSLQTLAHHALREEHDRQMDELVHGLRTDFKAEQTGLIAAEEAQIAAIQAKANAKIAAIRERMGRDASAMKDSQARKFKQEREQLEAAQMAAMEPMLPSLQATTEGWHRCAGGEACTRENGVQFFRPEERERPREGCNGASCTMHKRYCDDCCENPSWPRDVLKRVEGFRDYSDDEDETYRDLIVCNWCEQFLCPECYKGHEAACFAENKNRCGYASFQQYMTPDLANSYDEECGQVGKAEGHCGQQGGERQLERCREGENGDHHCNIIVCNSCAWTCQGSNWQCMDEPRACETRLCKLHAPVLGKPRKRRRHCYGSRSDAPSEEDAMYCGECDGEPPSAQETHDFEVERAEWRLQQARRQRDRALYW